MRAGTVFVLVAFIVVGLEMACAWRPPVKGPHRPGACPEVPRGTFGTCAELCTGDESCPGGKKCCSNGCGHSCTFAVPEKDGSDGHVSLTRH